MNSVLHLLHVHVADASPTVLLGFPIGIGAVRMRKGASLVSNSWWVSLSQLLNWGMEATCTYGQQTQP